MTKSDLHEILAALALGAVGVFVFFESISYGIGPATNMRSGNVPMLLGAILFLLAVGIGVTIWRRPRRVVTISWRPLMFVGIGIATFCVLLPLAGFLPTMVSIITICAVGDPDASVKGTFGLVVVVTFLSWLIFSVGLQVDLPLIEGL